MAPEPEMFTCRRGEIRLVGDRWHADAQRGAVVLLHGGGQTRHSWGRTAAKLAAEGWTAITLDLRGHGASDWDPGGDYSMDAFVDDLLGLLDGMDRPPALVGASLGGITSLLAAGEHPGRVTGLVLVDVVVEVEPAGVARIREFLTAHRNGFGSLDEVAEAIEAYNPVRKRARNLTGLRKNVRLHSDGRWYWHWDPKFIDDGDEPRRRTDTARLRRAASNLTIPTLLVRGLQSDVVSEAGLADMQRLVAHAEVIEVDQAGHMVAGDDNDVFSDRLNGFLCEVFSPAEPTDPHSPSSLRP